MAEKRSLSPCPRLPDFVFQAVLYFAVLTVYIESICVLDGIQPPLPKEAITTKAFVLFNSTYMYP